MKSKANDASIDFNTLRGHIYNNRYFYDPISPISSKDCIEKPELENINVVKEVAKDNQILSEEELDKLIDGEW